MKHGYYINTFLFLVFMHITVNQAKAEYCGYKLVRDLPDSSVTSSSVHKSYETHHGKLDKNPDGWIPDGRDVHPYLQFDLGKLFLICGFEVKGCELNNKGLYVTRYRVQVSPEIDFWDSWNYVKPEFYGSTSFGDKAYSVAKERKVGRYVRIFPVAYETPSLVKFKGCLKAEVYGIPYLREKREAFMLSNPRTMVYEKVKVENVKNVQVTISSKLHGIKELSIGETEFIKFIPAHTPLQTEVRVDSCVLAPYRPGYFISARVEKVLPYTDEYLIKELMKADDIRANPRKVKRDQLQVVFSAWCKIIDHVGRVSNHLCPGKIVQVDSKLVFKSPSQLGLSELSYQNISDKDVFSNTRLDRLGRAKDNKQIKVVYFRKGGYNKAECGIMTATIHYKFKQRAYVINGKRYTNDELWTEEKAEPDRCKENEKYKCFNSRIPFIVNRLNCSSTQVWNGYKCTDEDECSTGMAACGLYASCKDTSDYYNCYCPSGFLMGKARKEDCQDIDECKGNKNKCHEDAVCKNTIGSYTCQCKTGFKGNGRFCSDINECKNSANQKHCERHKNAFCKNFPGGYQCECVPGYHGDVAHCKDLDECTSKKHQCSPHAHCTNTIGSYQCKCKKGFHGDGRSCEDIKECKEPSKSRSCHTLGQCVDTLGGYKCECKEGYYGDGVKSCVLANECELGIHKCHKTWATCVNTRQSYECHCKKGFEGDGRTCEDVDECAKKQHKCNLKIKGVECRNTDGSYKCVCGKGFSGDGKQCVDIDECKLGSHNCVKDAICVNLDGRFSCKCREGFWGDGTKKCEPLTECMRRLPHCDVPRAVCSNKTNASGKRTYECFCKSGFTGDNSNCTDIDECLNKDACSRNAVCTNTAGGFSCRCKNGFEGNGFKCSDVNECFADKTVCPPNADCINIQGSFQCKCKTGFKGENPYKQCLDVDECTQYRICDYGQTCTNTFGSYDCSCDQGYHAINAEKNKCEDIDECKNLTTPCGKYNFIRCENTVGDYLCRCYHGFEFSKESKECKDIDECNTGKWPCAEEATCNNQEGSFSCACPKGYHGDGEYFCEGLPKITGGNGFNSSPTTKAAKTWSLVIVISLTLLNVSSRRLLITQ